MIFGRARLPDPDRLFSVELTGTTRRAITFFEGDKINERSLPGVAVLITARGAWVYIEPA